MFAVGTTVVAQDAQQSDGSSTSGQEEDRRCLAHLRGCFARRSIERVLLASLPEIEEMPQPLMPLGWEQRLDEKNGRIYFVDHTTCRTTWSDPRQEQAIRAQAALRSSAGDEYEEDADDLDAEEALAAAESLAALCVGISPNAEDGLQQWLDVLERSAFSLVKKVAGARWNAADALQYPRYMLLQKVHHAVVRRLLAPPVELLVVERVWAPRNRAVAAQPGGAGSALSKDVVAALAKLSAAGLTGTHKSRMSFSAPKMNLRKARKLLAERVPPPEQRLPAAPPGLPDGLLEQLIGLLIEPPGLVQGKPPSEEVASMWAMAADSLLSLCVLSGSLLSLLQLPRAVLRFPPGRLPAMPLAVPLFQLERRCLPLEHAALWPGFGTLLAEAGCRRWAEPPGEAELVAVEEAAATALAAAASLASLVWQRLAEREGVPLPAAQGDSPLGLSAAEAAARSLVELGANRSLAGPGAGLGADADAAASLTPQQATEMWQPLAVELRRETLVTLVTLLIAQLDAAGAVYANPVSGELEARARDKRQYVGILSTLRLLTVHLLLFHRCRIDAAEVLSPATAPQQGRGSFGGGADAELRKRLLDHLFGLVLAPAAGELAALHEALQAEAICALTAGLRALFPRQSVQLALLHACIAKQLALRKAGSAAGALEQLIAALCIHLGAESLVSRLVVPTENAPAPEVVSALLPGALDARPRAFSEIQDSLRRWLLAQVVREAEQALQSDPPEGAALERRSPCMQLLASLVQELLARASLCGHHRDAPNVALVRVAEDLLLGADEMLRKRLAPAATEAELARRQAQLSTTFVGSLVPWLIDSLALFSAFAFEYAQRLLPLVLPLLNTLKAVLGAGALPSLEEGGARPSPELAQQTTLQSAHPYKPDVEQVRRGKERRSLAQATIHAEEGSWPGATQLQLRFDAQCCTHEGDWLTLTFFKEGQPVEGRTLRFGGPWSNWPKQPITVPADSFRAEFAFSPLTATTAWGYGVAVTASKRDKANLLAMPVLAQLRLSLAYLGTKCASLLVAAEPVVEEEKENRHWLKSPLFARGLPLQLPPTHSLMHPFFGIKPVQREAATNTSAIRFLEDLTALGGGGATALHRHVVDATREPQAKAEEETTHAANAERALLASLLSHNGLLHVAQRAAREVCGGKAPQPPPASPPPSPPSEEAMPQEELADLRRFLDPEADGAAERPASASLGPLDAPGMGEEELSSLEAFLETQRSGASDSARSSARQDGEAAAAAAAAAAGAGAAGAVGVGAVWDAALHSKKLSREEWERLREQWRRARSLFSELAESHARTLTEEQKEADKGEGLARLMTFVLLVAKQNASQDERAAASDAAGEMQDLSGSMGSNVLKLFSNLTRRDAAPDAAGAQGRALEEEIRVWVGSRVAPEPLIQSMKRQQCRAYSRAAGFRAVCELLRVVDDAPSLQSRLLSSLEAILQPSQATRSSHMRIADHYSRDCICAGPHANGRLSLAFAAMLEQLVHLLGTAAVDPAAPSEQQLRSLKCLLHIELRCEDLPVLEAVRLLPRLHELVQRVHTAIWGEAPHAAAAEQSRPSIPRVPSQESVGSSLREPGPDSFGAPSEGGLRHSQTVQLLFQVFVSRLFAIQPAAAAAKHPFGLQRKLSVPGVDLSNTLRSPRGAPPGASTPSRWPSSLESAMVEALALDVQASASRMGGVASEETATVIGAHTAGETWVVSERFLHSALSLLFQLVAVPRTGTAAAFAGRDKWLSALFDALHVGSLRCARLVLRILQHVLPNTSPAKLSASVYEGSFRLTGGGDGSPDFADFLLMIIGDALAGELSHADPVLTFSRSLWRNAQVSSALGSEAVALAQLLLQSDVWSKSIQAALHRALLDVPGVVAALAEEARGSSSLSAGDPLLPSAVRAVGAFCVSGGNLRSLYIGCHVTVMPEQSATRETVEHGILVKWDGAEDSEVSVLLDSQATDLRLLKCSVLRLLPMEEAPLPLASFTLSPDVMSSFEIFLPKRKSGDETTTQPTALQANFLFGLLQTRALKAFRGLLQHAPAMRRVLHSGLFPSIMASATTPVPLIGAHTTEGLQGHVALLENMHVEAASAARFAKGHAQAAHARRTLAKQVRLERASSMASDEESERSAKEPKTPGGPLRATISQLEGMGFEYTLCQKAIGMFGHDTAAAAAWLSEDRTRKEQAGQLIRSPSWQQADELAQRTQLFSIAACKKALEHTAAAAAHGTLVHLDAAAAWLAEHGAEAEADVEAEEAAADGAGAVANLGRRPTEGVGSDGVDTGRQSGASASSPRGSCNGADVSLSQRSSEEGVSRTVSFTPQAESSYRLLSPSTGSQEVLHADADSGEGNIADSWTLQDEFQSATPPEARPYSSELSEAALALARSAAQFSFKRARSRPHVLQQARPLEPAECLAGRLLRPAPLSANTNCVLEGVDRSADGSLRLYTRNAETDVLQIILRRMVSCQRAETSLTAYLPELEHLGANSSGLNAVSGAAHTMLAILLVRQSVLCLLSDIQCLKESDEDATSAFSLEQLGRPRELLDLLKLAYHSSGHSSVGGGSAGSIAFSRLWGMIEGLMRGGRDAALLPGPFKALPLLLRDDALGHLRREKNGIATLQSPHPLEGTRMQSKHRLFVDGASSLLLKLDRRSELNGTAHILFSTDEDGTELVGRWPSPGVPWKDVRVEGDTVWCHLKGEVQGGSRPRRPLWGFRVRACVAGWRSPEGETQVLETPLAFAWQLLELLSEHRPLELLTQHTYIRLVQYLHARCAPHLTSAASVLLRLLKLPAKTLCDLEGPDPRLSWPMQHITALALHVNQFFEAHPGRAMRVPLQIQLYAELVARAVSRGPEAGLKLPPSDWMQSMSELNSACRFMLRDEGADTISDLPNVWLRQLEASGLELMLLNEPWSLAKYTTLLRFATQKIGGPKGELIDLSPKSLPAPTEDDGPVMAQCDQATVQVRFALLQLFNRVLLPCFGVAWTGEPQLGHTLGAELCSLRQIIFTEVKNSVWGITMDATIPFRRPAAIAANPPPTVTLNRRRALKERADRHAKTKHSVFVQLHNQLRAVERKELMRRERAFKVKFAGEAADDYGGPYREVFTVLASELENEAVLPLLQLSPNGKHNLGSNRDRFILNPGASSAESLQYFELVGMMFAFALMQKETVLTLSLCSVVWKQLVQEPLDTQDLAGFDESVMNSLEQIEHIDREGVDEDLFSDLIFEVFTTQLSHGVEVPICEGGADIDVTWSNRKHYCELVRKARLGESRQQAQAVLKGINSLLPSNLLPLFTHREIELMVCGAPDIDLSILRQHTRYGVTVDPDDSHIRIFWQVLSEFTAQQRTLFLSFIWSRTRLPATEEDWDDQCMKIHTLECTSPDLHLPVSHTCFFSMEWPRYSSVEIAKEKLLYAIVNCVDIDADNTAEGRSNMAMGRDDEL